MTEHRSKIDGWLIGVLDLAIIGSVVAGFVTARTGSISGWITAAVIVVVGVGLPVWLLVSTRYVIGDDQLLIRSGPLTWRIPLADISSITPTRNPLSSPALSLDRLRIEYGARRSVMISPRDAARFINDIEQARRHLAR